MCSKPLKKNDLVKKSLFPQPTTKFCTLVMFCVNQPRSEGGFAPPQNYKEGSYLISCPASPCPVDFYPCPAPQPKRSAPCIPDVFIRFFSSLFMVKYKRNIFNCNGMTIISFATRSFPSKVTITCENKKLTLVNNSRYLSTCRENSKVIECNDPSDSFVSIRVTLVTIGVFQNDWVNYKTLKG